ncbi:MAG TPA: hypothetical protein PLS49_03245 [Candidatus Woesebacteria bacterium]|nr:hypothetical protein [Candidatus Woesebacteria bacterium]
MNINFPKKLINHRYFEFIFFIFIFLFISILGILGISGSSVGIYNSALYGESYDDENLIIGQLRGIRSDEWLVNTQYTSAQYNNDFSRFNDNVGDGQDMGILYDLPVKDWTVIFKPLNSLYFFLPLELAFSLEWWLRGFALLFSTYLLLRKITKNRLISLLGSFTILFTPFLNWWYSTLALEIVIYASLVYLAFHKLLESKEHKFKILYSLLLSYFCISFVLLLYPPFQISIGLGLLFIATGNFINKHRVLDKKELIKDLIHLFIALTTIIVIILLFYLDYKETINTILATSYPGLRVIEGGGYNYIKFFNFPYNYSLLFNSNPVPEIFANQSEASNFFMGFLFVLPFIWFSSIKRFLLKRKSDFMELLLLIFLSISLLWLFIGLPTLFERLLLLDKVPMERMIIGIGFWGYILSFYYLSRKQSSLDKLDLKILSFIVAVIVSIINFNLGKLLMANYPTFPLSTEYLVISSLSIGLTIYLLITRHSLALLIVMISSVFLSISINPLYRGLSTIDEGKLINGVKRVEQSNIDNSRWVYYGGILWQNILVANGISSISSTHYYPQLEMWEILDPEKEFYDYYNRYAHIQFNKPNLQQDRVVLNSPDHISVYIDPCSSELEELRVKYILSDSELNGNCLNVRENIHYEGVDFFIYEIN